MVITKYMGLSDRTVACSHGSPVSRRVSERDGSSNYSEWQKRATTKIRSTALSSSKKVLPHPSIFCFYDAGRHRVPHQHTLYYHHTNYLVKDIKLVV